MSSPLPYTYVNKEDQLQDSIDALKGPACIAIDTEFQREKTYYPIPCLIQISNGTDSFLFDVLNLDCKPLWDYLKTSDQVKILHSASQDIEVFDMFLDGTTLSHVFDTQLAVKFLDIDTSISLASVVETFLNCYIEKSQTVSDWTKRPLNQAQLNYACEDVLYLHQLHDILKQKLIDANKYEYFIEDCDSLTHLKDPLDNFCDKNLKTTDSDHQKNLLKTFYKWRENFAKERNIPKGWVLKDHQLRKILKTSHHETWLDSGALSERQYLRYKKTFLDLHHSCDHENKKRHQMTQAEKTTIESLNAKLKRLINRVTEAENLTSELICNQRTLKIIADSMIIKGEWKKFTGWRGKLLNTKFNQILESQQSKLSE